MQDNPSHSFWDDAPAFAHALCAPISISAPIQETGQATETKVPNVVSEDGSLITSDTDQMGLSMSIPIAPLITPAPVSGRKRTHPSSGDFLSHAPPPSPASKRHRASYGELGYLEGEAVDGAITSIPSPMGNMAIGESVAMNSNGTNNSNINGPTNYLSHVQSIPPSISSLPLPVQTSISTCSVSTSPCVNEKLKTSPCVKSHTRRCREKVNEKFANLLEALPSAPPGVEVKHKAQILEYTLQVFRALLARRNRLRVDIALASETSLRDWCETQPLSAFAALYARKHRWPYVETWKNGQLTAAHSDVLHSHLRNLANACMNTTTLSGMGIVERATNSKRPEWLPIPVSLPIMAGGERKPCILRHEAVAAVGINVILAIPTIREDAVLLFMDTKRRNFGIEAVDQLFKYANIVVDTHQRHAMCEEDAPVEIRKMAEREGEKGGKTKVEQHNNML